MKTPSAWDLRQAQATLRVAEHVGDPPALKCVAEWLGWHAGRAEREAEGVKLIRKEGEKRKFKIGEDAAQRYYRAHREEIDAGGADAIEWSSNGPRAAGARRTGGAS